MNQIIIFVLCVFSLNSYSQNRVVHKVSSEDIIGVWELTKKADKHLNYLSDSVKKEKLVFTKDSVFVTTDDRKYCGTWKLVGGQLEIKILGTNNFKYVSIAGDANSKFLTRKGLGYYKYFIRIGRTQKAKFPPVPKVI